MLHADKQYVDRFLSLTFVDDAKDEKKINQKHEWAWLYLNALKIEPRPEHYLQLRDSLTGPHWVLNCEQSKWSIEYSFLNVSGSIHASEYLLSFMCDWKNITCDLKRPVLMKLNGTASNHLIGLSRQIIKLRGDFGRMFPLPLPPGTTTILDGVELLITSSGHDSNVLNATIQRPSFRLFLLSNGLFFIDFEEIFFTDELVLDLTLKFIRPGHLYV